MPATSMGKNRALELYSLGKQRSEKKDKDKIEIEYEKSCDECTFQPNISSSKHNKYHIQDPTQYYAKGVDQTIYRLRNANNEREQMNLKMNERAFTTGKEGTFSYTLNAVPHKSKASIENQTKGGFSNRRSVKESQGKPHNDDLSSINNESHSMLNSEEKLKIEKGQIIHSGNGDQIFDEHPYRQHQDDQYQEYEAQIEVRAEHNLQIHENEDSPDIIQHHHDVIIDSNEERNEDHHEDIQLDTENNHETEGKEGEHAEGENPDKVPLLFVDVNLGAGKSERIVIYEGDDSLTLANQFSDKHGLDAGMKVKLKEMLDSQIAGLLARIEEEEMNSGNSGSDHDHDNQVQETEEAEVETEEKEEEN